METKRFPLRVLLTVTTGRLLTQSKGPRNNGIDDLYEILNWMTGDSAFTHQLPRFAAECKPWLLKWFPEIALAGDAGALANLDASLEALGAERGVEDWLAWVGMRGTKAEYDVPKLPAGTHQVRDPVEELAERVGPEKVIVVKTEE